MTSYESLMPRILPQVLPCPRSMAMDAAQMLAVDFCKESGVWKGVFEEQVCACERDVSFALPKGAKISQIKSVSLNGERLDCRDYEAAGDGISLKIAPARASLLVVEAELRPLRTSMALPSEIMEEFGDVIAFGAIAKLKAMSGNKVEWSDPKGAATYYQLYQDQIAKSKLLRFRRKFGGILYVNTGSEL